MSFKVTIINNENGEVLVNEENAGAVIGAVETEKDVCCLGFTECNIVQLAQAVEGAQNAIKTLMETKPAIELFLKLKSALLTEADHQE